MRRSYSAAGTFSLSLSRLDIEKPPGDIHRWRRTNLVVTGLWLLAFVQSPADKIFLFSPKNTKKFFDVDGYGVELGVTLTKERTDVIAYWHGMWSHRQKDRMWKGFVAIDLDPSEDGPALALLNSPARQRRLL